jgi:hypothetical protein
MNAMLNATTSYGNASLNAKSELDIQLSAAPR